MARVIKISYDNNEPVHMSLEGNHLKLSNLQLIFPFAKGLTYMINNEIQIVIVLDNVLVLPHNVSDYELLYHCRDVAVEEINVKERLIVNYFYKKYTYAEISGILQKKDGITVSVRTIKRILQKYNLRRKNIIESPKEEILATLIFEIENTNMNLGYRAMTQHLRRTYNLNVLHSTVLEMMRLVDPQGIEARSRYRLKRRMYHVPGPNYLWHIDGHDKLILFGFAIHACIDGFSRMVLWLEVATSNKNPKIIASYYLKCVQKLNKIPAVMRSDKGTENTLVDVLHIALRSSHTDEQAGHNSFKKGKSTANERVEKHWKHLRESTLDYFIHFFTSMKENGILDIQDKIQLEVLRFCFGPLIQTSLNAARIEWNEHRIQKQKNVLLSGAIPSVMYYWPEKYNCQDCSKKVNQEDISMMLNDYCEKPTLYSPHIKDLINLLIPNCPTPRTSNEAYDLFINVTRLMEN